MDDHAREASRPDDRPGADIRPAPAPTRGPGASRPDPTGMRGGPGSPSGVIGRDRIRRALGREPGPRR
jgi:hypothetical protein